MRVSIDVTIPSAVTLLSMLADFRLKFIQLPDSDPEKKQIRETIFKIFDQVKKKLSSDKADIAAVNDYFKKEKARGDPHAQNILDIEESIRKFYKSTYESLTGAANTIAGLIYDERVEIFSELSNITHGEFKDSAPKDFMNNSNRATHIVNLLEGNAIEAPLTLASTREEAIRNNSEGDALKKLWASLKFEKTREFAVTDEAEIFTDTNPTEDFHFYDCDPVKEQTLLNNNATWMDYREKTQKGMEFLSTKSASILLQESNPIGSFFMGILNTICESTGINTILEIMGVSLPFEQHKKQQSYKETIGHVREITGLEEKSPANDPKSSMNH